MSFFSKLFPLRRVLHLASFIRACASSWKRRWSYSFFFRQPIRWSGPHHPGNQDCFSCYCPLRDRKSRSWEQISWMSAVIYCQIIVTKETTTHTECFFDKAVGRGATRRLASAFLLEYIYIYISALSWLEYLLIMQLNGVQPTFILLFTPELFTLWHICDKPFPLRAPCTPTLVFYLNVAD